MHVAANCHCFCLSSELARGSVKHVAKMKMLELCCLVVVVVVCAAVGVSMLLLLLLLLILAVMP